MYNHFINESNSRNIKYKCIDDGDDFKTIPFMKNAISKQLLQIPSENSIRIIYRIQHNKGSGSLMDFIKNTLSKKDNDEYLCAIDCYIFLRILELYTIETLGKQLPETLIFELGSASFLTKLYNYCYLCPKNNIYNQCSTHISSSSKSQWLIKMSNNEYMGLTGTGPLIATEQEWSDRLTKYLKIFLCNALITSPNDDIEVLYAGIMSDNFKWHIVHQK